MGGTSGRLFIYDTRSWRLLLTVLTPGPVTSLAAFGRDWLVSGHQRTVRTSSATTSATGPSSGSGGGASVSSVAAGHLAASAQFGRTPFSNVGLGNYASSAAVAETDILFVWDARRWNLTPVPLRSEQSAGIPSFLAGAMSTAGSSVAGALAHQQSHARRSASSASSYSSASSASPRTAGAANGTSTGARPTGNQQSFLINPPSQTVAPSMGGKNRRSSRQDIPLSGPKAPPARHQLKSFVAQPVIQADMNGISMLDSEQLDTITTAAALAASSSLLSTFASAAGAAADAAHSASSSADAVDVEHARAWTQAQEWAQQQVCFWLMGDCVVNSFV